MASYIYRVNSTLYITSRDKDRVRVKFYKIILYNKEDCEYTESIEDALRRSSNVSITLIFFLFSKFEVTMYFSLIFIFSKYLKLVISPPIENTINLPY